MKFLTAILLFSLVSCASHTKEDCIKSNLAIIGGQDAMNGYSSYRFKKHQQDCKGLRIIISKENYLNGHNKGLKILCTYRTWYSYGKEGSDPFAECDKITHSYSKGYQDGLKEFQKITKEKKLEVEKSIEKKKQLRIFLLATILKNACSTLIIEKKELASSINAARVILHALSILIAKFKAAV